MPASQEMGGGRVLIIGLDGATFALLNPWIERGLTPNLQRLVAEGAQARLRSVIPPVTGPAWTSFSTGVRPGKHGIFDFAKRVPGTMARQIVTRLDIRVPTLWDMLATAGLQVGLINLPVTYPPSEHTSFHITDMLTPSTAPSFTHPAGLYDELRPELGEYIVDPQTWRLSGSAAAPPFLEAQEQCDRQRTRYAVHLLRTRPWDVAALVYVGTDRIQHLLWDILSDEFAAFRRTPEMLALKERAERYVAVLDEMIGEVVAACPPDTDVLVVSDHGFGPLRTQFSVNQWLARHKLLVPSRRRGMLWRLLVSADVLRVGRRLKRFLLAPHRAAGAKGTRVGELPFWRWINWERTRAYAPSASSVGVCVNLQGREVHGSVPPADYEKVRDEIIACLQKLRDPQTGEPMLEGAVRREEVFAGDCLDGAPDVLFALRGGEWRLDVRLEGPLLAKASAAPWRLGTGTHRFEGVLIGRGPRIRTGSRLAEAEIVDIVPTVLWLCGLAAPAHLDGRVLKELLTDRVPAPTRTVEASVPSGATTARPYSEEETREVEARLRDLGYL